MRLLDRIDRCAIGTMLDRDGYFWLDLGAPSDADVDTLDRIFRFHPPALEDLRKKRQRPKLEASATTCSSSTSPPGIPGTARGSASRRCVVATIFLPLSFVVGFFGQNFGWVVGHLGSAADFAAIGGGSIAALARRAAGLDAPLLLRLNDSWQRRRSPDDP